MRLRPLAIALLLASPGVELSAQQSAGVPRFTLETADVSLGGHVRPGSYIAETGRRGALFGDESGTLEAWVWPVKLVRDLRLAFAIPDYDLPIAGATVAASVTVRPAGQTITYSHATFTVHQHLLVPEDEPGAIILLEVATVRPLEVLVQMHADFNLAWPGSLGGAGITWVDGDRAFRLTQGGVRLYNGIVGSPFAEDGTSHPAHDAASIPSQFTLRFDEGRTTREFIPIVIAGGAMPRDSATAVYQRLLRNAPRYWREKQEYHARRADQWLTISTPDDTLDQAYRWAAVNLDRQRVCNPDLGCGSVAGFGRAGAGNFRPGFGWYFGGDAAINSLAMSAIGQHDQVREAIAFLARYQRGDGKIPHEISHAAAKLPWFTDYPYTWYHGDTTPFWLLACTTWWRATGDDAFLRELWPAITRAFRWSAATDIDGDGLMENPSAGAGAIEVGGLGEGLLTDIYLAGVWVAALDGLRDMARTMGDEDLARDAGEIFERARRSLDDEFWLDSAGRYAFALLQGGTPSAPRRNDALTPWPATAMTFGLLDDERAQSMLREMSSAALLTDWGTRLLDRNHALYEPLHYNNGAVWPFVTGFTALANYRYHRAWTGYELVQAVARMTFDFHRGRQPELLSGAFYQLLDTTVPDQFFASSMLVNPLVRGLLGVESRAGECLVRIAPHLPAHWDTVSVGSVEAGCGRIAFRIERSTTQYRIEVSREEGAVGQTGERPVAVELAPAFPRGATVTGVRVNGATAAFETLQSAYDLHATVRASLGSSLVAEFDRRGGIEVVPPAHRPEIGQAPSGLRVVDVRHEGTEMLIDYEGLAGRDYALELRGDDTVVAVDGAELARQGDGAVELRIRVPEGADWERRLVRVRVADR
jgi:glycogen debranching enzyme